jgi:DNA-binding transcriptional ArsR family regulator
MGADLPPEEAFALLANETRMEVLRVLGAAAERGDGTARAPAAVQFSDLFAAVGIDDTGNFSYHLEKLEGHFVEVTEGGYVLTEEGATLLELVRELEGAAFGEHLQREARMPPETTS